MSDFRILTVSPPFTGSIGVWYVTMETRLDAYNVPRGLGKGR